MVELKGARRLVGWSVAAGLALAATTGAALAQSAAQKAVTARQESYKQLGGAFKSINDELKAGSPDMAKIAAAATKMNTLAGQAPGWFPKGSGVESGAKTEALPVIWSDAAGFASAHRALRTETAKLEAVAAAGDLSALKAQVRATGGACKGCHDKYREAKK